MPFRNTTTGEYPVSQEQIRLANPNTSFPAYFEEATGYDWITPVVPPVYNVDTQYVEEGAPSVENTQTWVVYDFTPEQIESRRLTKERQIQQTNKGKAMNLLQATDWSATAEIANPAVSDPYLANQSDFFAYRSDVRKIAVNPPIVIIDDKDWPVIPKETWG